MYAAKRAFEKAFGIDDDTKVIVSEYKGENALIVENKTRKAIYNFSIELLKLINFTGDKK